MVSDSNTDYMNSSCTFYAICVISRFYFHWGNRTLSMVWDSKLFCRKFRDVFFFKFGPRAISISPSRKRYMLGNQDHASRVNSASWVPLLFHASALAFWSKFLHWFCGKFFLLYFSVTLNCLEAFWVRQIKKLEENNHRFAAASVRTFKT